MASSTSKPVCKPFPHSRVWKYHALTQTEFWSLGPASLVVVSLAACLNLDSTPSPVLLVRNAIPAFNFLYTLDTEHPKPHPRSQLSSQPHPHHFICLGHDSRSADVCTVSFALPSQLLTSKTKQNSEHRDIREPRGCVLLSTLDQIIRRHVHTCFKSLLNPKLANSVYLYQIRLGATMHLPPEQDSSTVDYPKRG